MEALTPCLISSLILTLIPIPAKAINSKLLLINLNVLERFLGNNPRVNSAHIIKKPMTYQGTLTLVFLCSILFSLVLEDRKSTRLNSSHANISYAVFCLKKKKNKLINYKNIRGEPIFDNNMKSEDETT